MFFYLPLTSNAELRYWPFATGAIIAINCLAFAIQLLGPSSENYVLSHGDGLHPVQWITSFFMHDGLLHLLGNMLFLWIFGHMVEGAVGPGKFVAMYLVMGIFQNLVEQLIFLGSPGPGSLGASSAIYAIMAVAGWLCPEDNIQGYFLLFIGFLFRAFFLEVPMFIFAVFYLGFDICLSILVGFEASTPVLHALGGIIGVVVGFVLLKLEIIENEGRDLLSFSQSRGSKPKLTKRQQVERAQAVAENKAVQDQQRATYLQSLNMHMKAENVEGCITQWINFQRRFPEFVLPENMLLPLLNLVQKKQRWTELVQIGECYLQHYTAQETTIRLKLAVVLVSKLTRPSAALRILQGLSSTTTNDADKQQARKIAAAAKKMIADGVLDIAES